MVQRLTNVSKGYAWGSKSLIPGLLGQPAADFPIAEVWFGSHPRGSSILEGSGASLEAAIRSDPERLLGRALAEKYGPALPFLLKLIAVERPLSIQAHPSAAQAKAGFEYEQAAGIAVGAAERCYPDPHHKPELLVALTEFEALAGFRSTPDVLSSLQGLGILDDLKRIGTNPQHAGALESLLRALFHLDKSCQRELVDRAVRACREQTEDEADRALRLRVLEFAGYYPGDIGLIVMLFLNYVKLRIGEALYLAPGMPHAYVRGLGVEIMANSDNVLRCGLTNKHADAEALLAVLDFTNSRPSAFSPMFCSRGTAYELVYETPAHEFLLSKITLSDDSEWTPAPTSSPQVLLATRGRLQLIETNNGALQPSLESRPSLELQAGEAVFIAPNEQYVVRGVGDLFRASAGA